MKKATSIWIILACALLMLGFAECDMGSSTDSALTTCDAGPDVACPAVTPDPGPASGW